MAKIGELGNSGLGQVPPGWSDNSSQKTLFKQWPTFPGKGEIGPLEPYGNPAYEGYGYPAAGYGQKRNKVVGLALPKVASPQLSSNGWSDKVPQGTLVTPMGTLNRQSDRFTRAEVAVLQGLAGFSNCNSATDARMWQALQGLAAVAAGEPAVTSAQSFIDAMVRGVLPSSLVDRIVKKILDDEVAAAAAYNDIQALKKKSPTDKRLPALQTKQEMAWSQLNTAKYYALLIPEFQKRLGFTTGKPKVTPPDYNYIKAKGDSGVFSRVGEFLRQKLVGDVTQNLINAGYVKGTLNGLGEPISITAVSIVVASVAAAGLWAYLSSKDAGNVAAETARIRLELIKDGKLTPEEAKALAEADAKNQEKAGDSSGLNVTQIAKYGAMAVGALILLQLVTTVKDTLPTKS